MVEGASGFYSSIARGALNADLAGGLGVPVLLVVPNRLGAINHVALTVEAAHMRGLALAGVVLNQPEFPAPRRHGQHGDYRTLVVFSSASMPFAANLDLPREGGLVAVC